MTKYNSAEALKKDLIKKMQNAMRVGALQCFQNIVVGSPVDTGRFRMNWQATINTPNKNQVGEQLPTKKDVNGNPIKNQFTQVTDYKSPVNSYTLDDTLYLTNNLPYALRIANGWSAQRSSGWIDVEVEKAKDAISTAFKRMNS